MNLPSLLIAGFALLTTAASAQTGTYAFQRQMSTFNSLPSGNPTDLDTLDLFDDIVLPEKKAIPFSFNFNGNIVDSVGISENGYLWFGPAQAALAEIGGVNPISTSHGSNVRGIISAYGGDLHPHVMTPQPSYLFTGTLGTAPQRIFVVEWSNTGRIDALSDPAGEDTISFQIRLHEYLNRVEIVFGNVYLNQNVTTLAEFGLKGATHTDFHNRVTVINGNWDATIKGTNVNNTCEFDYVKHPVAGESFSFTPGFTTGIAADEVSSALRVVYPVQQELQVLGITADQAPAQVFNAGGQLLLQGTLQEGKLDVSGLSQGVYFLVLANGQQLPFIK